MKQSELTQHFKGRGPLLLIVLDGWGVGAHGEGDAIFQAFTPTIEAMGGAFAKTTLYTHGHYVGLPAVADIGGSEVGHLTMGAGEVLPQGPTRIEQMMDSGEFFEGKTLNGIIDKCLEADTPLHLLGLLSDGKVHSHVEHIYRIIDHAEKRGIRRLYVHALLDGRDVPFQSALDYVEPMEARLEEIGKSHPGWDYAIASGGGREVITMDRDTNWDKVKRGWETHVLGRSERAFPSASAAVKEAREHAPDMIDQDQPPFVVVSDGEPVGPIGDGHGVIFVNFRGDRAIEFTQAMVLDDFQGFEREKRPRVHFAGMMTYDEDTNLPPATLMVPARVERPFGRRILDLGLTQFRLAETQKYAHVTFFFNGGYREPLDPDKEDYIIIPSDKIDSFAEAPAMKAREIADKAVDLIIKQRHQFGLINFANADMVGHTGNLQAAIRAVQAVDNALMDIFDALAQVGGMAIVTADHGNAEEMIEYNPKFERMEISTRHSINPVPVSLFDPDYSGEYHLRQNSEEAPLTLANLASTCFTLLGQPNPDDLAEPLFIFD